MYVYMCIYVYIYIYIYIHNTHIFNTDMTLKSMPPNYTREKHAREASLENYRRVMTHDTPESMTPKHVQGALQYKGYSIHDRTIRGWHAKT